MNNLIRIKIPAGWIIDENNFVDEIPIKSNEDDYLENWFNFTEDILQISKFSLNEEGEHFLPKRHLLIDLGWYPDSSFKGEYNLCLVFVDPDADMIWDYISEFSSRDRFEIRDKIEEWLEKLICIDNNSKSKEDIIKILEKN